MPHNPDLSRLVAGYVDPGIHKRMQRIRKAKPRFNFSHQINRSLEANIDALEELAGLKPLKKNLPS